MVTMEASLDRAPASLGRLEVGRHWTKMVCVVCHEAHDVAEDCNFYRLAASGLRVVDKMQDWEKHRFPTLSPQSSGFGINYDDEEMRLPVCSSCLDLIATVDRLEIELEAKFNSLTAILRNRNGLQPFDCVEFTIKNEVEDMPPTDASDDLERNLANDSNVGDDPLDFDVARFDDEEDVDESFGEPSDDEDPDYEVAVRPRRESRKRVQRALAEEPPRKRRGRPAKRRRADSPETKRGRKSVRRKANSKRISEVEADYATSPTALVRWLIECQERMVGGQAWLRPSHCRLCSCEFPSHEVFLQHHAQTHPGEAPFVCHLCFAAFESIKKYTFHVLFEDLRLSVTGDFACRVCRVPCLSLQALERHWSDQHGGTDVKPFICDPCDGAEFETLQSFVDHRLLPSDKHLHPERTKIVDFDCTQCPAKFCGEEELISHCKSEHEEGKVFQCPHCRKFRPSMYSMHTHLVNVEFARNHVCEQCGLRFSTSLSWETHQNQEHLNRFPFKCNECGKGFSSRSGLMGHCAKTKHEAEVKGRTITNSESWLESEDEADSGSGSLDAPPEDCLLSPDQQVSCKQCGMKYSNLRTLKLHEKSAHGEITPFDCPHCSSSFVRESVLKRHLKEVHLNMSRMRGRLQCSECSKTCANQDLLRTHMCKAHGAAPSVPCKKCDRKFITSKEVRCHSARCDGTGNETVVVDEPPKSSSPKKASGENDFAVCQICGVVAKGPAARGKINYHVTAVHEKVKKFKCHLCPEAFEHHGSRRRHLARVHKIGVESFQFTCDVCGQFFEAKRDMERHKFSKHNILMRNIQVYTCPHCSKQFIKKQAFEGHVRLHAGVKPHTCPQCEYTSTLFGALKRHMRVAHGRNVKRVFAEGCKEETVYTLMDIDGEDDAMRKRATSGERL